MPMLEPPLPVVNIIKLFWSRYRFPQNKLIEIKFF